MPSSNHVGCVERLTDGGSIEAARVSKNTYWTDGPGVLRPETALPNAAQGRLSRPTIPNIKLVGGHPKGRALKPSANAPHSKSVGVGLAFCADLQTISGRAAWTNTLIRRGCLDMSSGLFEGQQPQSGVCECTTDNSQGLSMHRTLSAPERVGGLCRYQPGPCHWFLIRT